MKRAARRQWAIQAGLMVLAVAGLGVIVAATGQAGNGNGSVGEGACFDPITAAQIAIGQFDGAQLSVSEVSVCRKVCVKGRKYCDDMARESTRCIRKAIRKDESVEQIACDDLDRGDQKSTCKNLVKKGDGGSNDQKSLNKSAFQIAREACEAYNVACFASCLSER